MPFLPPTDEELEAARVFSNQQQNAKYLVPADMTVRRTSDVIYIDFNAEGPGEEMEWAYNIANALTIIYDPDYESRERYPKYWYRERGCYFEYTPTGFKYRKRKKGE